MPIALRNGLFGDWSSAFQAGFSLPILVPSPVLILYLGLYPLFISRDTIIDRVYFFDEIIIQFSVYFYNGFRDLFFSAT